VLVALVELEDDLGDDPELDLLADLAAHGRGGRGQAVGRVGLLLGAAVDDVVDGGALQVGGHLYLRHRHHADARIARSRRSRTR